MNLHSLFILFSLLPLLVHGQEHIPLADPYILTDDTDGMYYAYGTHATDGIEVYTSTDLNHWSRVGLALSSTNTTESRWFWAPEVYKRGDTYYMFYSANEHLYLATSTSPIGPFIQSGGRLMHDLIGDEKCIDSSVFFDDDGHAYMYFVRFNAGNNIWMCQLDSTLSPLATTLHPCLEATEPWELRAARVAEGPFVIKYQGLYYLTYSANDYQSHDYAVGYATSESPYGPWQKSTTNPILHRYNGLYGTGHHSFFTTSSGQLHIVYHAHNSATAVHPRLMYIGEAGFEGSRLVIK